MRTFQQVSPLRTYLREIRREGKIIGLVPTMGALHEGHLSLFRRARNDCDLVIGTVFVNPTQFGPNEDLDAYPRNLPKDMQLAAQEHVDALFVPTVEEMYPNGFQTTVHAGSLSADLEGKHRPGHFDGVVTVVAKLFNIVQADRAYFGQKDYQQFLVIDQMARDLNMPLDVVMLPTVREASGLALSSRNAYLQPDEKEAALVLYRALEASREAVAAGERSSATLEALLRQTLLSCHGVKVDYAVVRHPDTLEPLESLEDTSAAALLAVRVGRTRLLDNTLLTPPGVQPPRPMGHRTT